MMFTVKEMKKRVLPDLDEEFAKGLSYGSMEELKKNISENYYNKILNKKESNTKKKEDVNVSEAFELYLLKNFLDDIREKNAQT